MRIKLEMKKRALVIASGPSLNQIPHHLLSLVDATKIAVNRSIEWFPESDYLFTLDTVELNKRFEGTFNFKGQKVAAIPADYGRPDAKYACDKAQKRVDTIYLPRIQWQPDDDDNAIRSGCSGYGAYELAYKNRAEEIFLFGCDHSHMGVYFHGGRASLGRQDNWNNDLRAWNATVPEVPTFNVCPQSKITSLEKIDWQAFCMKVGILPSPIVTVLKTGGVYNHNHVNSLYKQLMKYGLEKYLICLTDDPTDIKCKTYPLTKQDWPGWWSKMEMFAPWNFLGDFLYVDLDTTFVDHPGRYLALKETTVLRDFYKPLRNIGSGLMFIKHEDCNNIWFEFMKDPKKHMQVAGSGGDQMFLNAFFEKKAIWGKEVVSYKVHCQSNGGKVPDGTRIVCFHGVPKPWDVKGWVEKYE